MYITVATIILQLTRKNSDLKSVYKTIISIMENKNYPNLIDPIAKYAETLTVEVN